MKTFDVDKYLNERTTEVKINGKTFTVKDIPDDAQDLMNQEDIQPKEIVKKVLGCTDDDLKGYGTAAYSAIINEVTQNLFPDSSQNDQSAS